LNSSSYKQLWESVKNPLQVELGLFLRRACIDDHVNLFKYNTGNVRESFFDFTSEQEACEWLKNSISKCENSEKLEFILYSDTEKFIGSIGINNLQSIPEFGLWIRGDLQRQGCGRKVVFLSSLANKFSTISLSSL
jgi:RimJ/RimL family protein N-acetyltransferase